MSALMPFRKLVSPCVNDDQKIDLDNQKLNSDLPRDYWILDSLVYKILFIFSILLLLCKKNTLEEDHKCVRATNFCIQVVL